MEVALQDQGNAILCPVFTLLFISTVHMTLSPVNHMDA